MSKPIIGVMGPGDGASQEDIDHAYELGKLIAEQNWILLTGGRDTGVMNAASKGAKRSGGLTIGILPSENKDGMSGHVDIPICTGMGSARNNINVLSSDVVVACGTGAGTASEILLALKAEKPLVLLNPDNKLTAFLNQLSYPRPRQSQSAQETIALIKNSI
jgi:uncharacterized protein (TIGR00725 family)